MDTHKTQMHDIIMSNIYFTTTIEFHYEYESSWKYMAHNSFSAILLPLSLTLIKKTYHTVKVSFKHLQFVA
jgi:hypothetical protein